MNKSDLKQLIDKVNELFITWRKNYIYQIQDGSYKDSISFGGKLSDTEIEEHLQHKKTIGVKINKITKFILFDVDIPNEKECKFTVNKIKNGIEQFGIPKEYIYVIDSGSKGYHCILFFDEVIPITYLKTFYKYILEFTNCNIHQIELRPTRQGVKLPLSINRKTGRICYFVDNNFKVIEDNKYLLGVKQYSASIMIEMIKDYERDISKLNNLNETIENNYTTPKSYKENIDSEYTFEIAETIEKEGIKFKGTRHHCLMKLGSMYNTLGYSQQDIEYLLVEWMNNQDKNMYSTPYDKCLIDIKEISKYVVDKNIQITTNIKDISVSKDECLKIAEVKGNKGKLIMYCLMVHAKRYASKTGKFYITYNQIMKSCNINSKTTIKKYIDELQNIGYIEISRRDKYNEKLPNQYIVKILDNENKDYIVSDNIIDLSKSFNNCMNKLFNKNELKKLFTRREYERLIC